MTMRHEVFHVNPNPRSATHETFHVNPFFRAAPAPVFVTALLGIERHSDGVMTLVSSFQASALSLLQQANRPLASPDAGDRAGVSLVAAANGVAPPEGANGAGPSQQAKAKVAETFFKPNAPSVTEMKLHLMKRLGEKFDIKLEDHESHASFGTAIRFEINKLKMQPGGALILSAIEKELGFDKLGFSLDEFVNAIIDPTGTDGRKIDAALKDHLGIDDEDDEKASDARAALEALRVDDSGLYGFVNR